MNFTLPIDKYTYIVLYNLIVFISLFIYSFAHMNREYKDDTFKTKFIVALLGSVILWFDVFVATSIVFTLLW